jgi:predicted lipid-binding transport protein (Tim44 family)
MQLANSRKLLKICRYTLFTAVILIYADFLHPKPAQAILFSAFSKFVGGTVKDFLGKVGASAIGDSIDGLLSLIPWVVIVMICGFVTWQVIEGYKEYEQQNFSGVAGAATKVIVLVSLAAIADKVTAWMTS